MIGLKLAGRVHLDIKIATFDHRKGDIVIGYFEVVAPPGRHQSHDTDKNSRQHPPCAHAPASHRHSFAVGSCNATRSPSCNPFATTTRSPLLRLASMGR